ncbi:cation diffusion facilitator family transporter [Floccifex sp.]|uniref:cation diffusion facilitator family transporter n=1 Tax=Floccifex sp. TaxID=2815810 RepID=UPI003F112403
MISFLVSKFVKNASDTKSADVRSAVGTLCGWIGICNNIFLFLIKFIIGILVTSVSIQADAINNLTDAGSNIISIISFYFSNKPADKDHPYGHQRSESIASLFVGVIIVFLGFEMIKESVIKIIHPQEIDFRWITILILLISISVKLWMYSYNKKLSKVYESSLLEATALDSISDVLGTTGVLLSTILSPIIHFNLDGYMGIVVSVIILWNAYNLLKEVINSLIGQAPDSDFVNEIVDIILSDARILGVHDFILHDYGPNKQFASAHVEVDSENDIFEIHDHIDNVERAVKEKMGIELVLHMDPVRVNDPKTEYYKEKVKDAICLCNPEWKFHDFRIVTGPTHDNLVFDLVIPFEETKTKKEIENDILSHMNVDKIIYLVITIDHPFA